MKAARDTAEASVVTSIPSKFTAGVLVISILVASSGCATFGGQVNSSELEKMCTQTKSVAIITTHDDSKASYLLFKPRPFPLLNENKLFTNPESLKLLGINPFPVGIVVYLPFLLWDVFIALPVAVVLKTAQATYPTYQDVVLEGNDPSSDNTTVIHRREPLFLLSKEKVSELVAPLDKMIGAARIPVWGEDSDRSISSIAASQVTQVGTYFVKVLGDNDRIRDSKELDYRVLRQNNIDLVIEVNIKRRGFVGHVSIDNNGLLANQDPGIYYLVSADVRARKVSDGKRIYGTSFLYESVLYNISRLATDETLLRGIVVETEERFHQFMKSYNEQLFHCSDKNKSSAELTVDTIRREPDK